MAMSCKGDDHSGVDHIYSEELKTLEKGRLFYHVGLRRFVKVKLVLLDTCVDRPERSVIFQCGDHNGSYSAYWGHACKVDDLCKDNHLPSCNSCRLQRVHNLLACPNTEAATPHSCANCASWNVMAPGFLSVLPQKYPTRCGTAENAPSPPLGRDVGLQKLPTVRLTTQWLQEALKFAHHNMRTKPPNARTNSARFWNKEVLTSYLRSCGITKKLIEQVHNSAKK